ncbi:hypothetical protein ALC57_14631, partial [Trachymyrmex cornetzi]
LDTSSYKASVEEMSLLEIFEKETACKVIEQQGLLYVAGYVAYRFRSKYNYLGTRTSQSLPHNQDWLHFISKGNLMYPSDELLKIAKIMDIEFCNFHGNTFSSGDGIFDKVTNIVFKKSDCKLPREVVTCLVRTRTYFRLRNINKSIMDACTRKSQKKMKHIVH